MTNSLNNKLKSPSIDTSITTTSTSFDFLNATVATVNEFGAATTLNIGYNSTDNSTINISTGNVASNKTKRVNIATASSGASDSNTTVIVGSVFGISKVYSQGTTIFGINGAGHVPTDGNLAGLGIVWNKNGNASGATYFQNYRQGGAGGFYFELYSTAGASPSLLSTPLSIDGSGNIIITGGAFGIYQTPSSSTYYGNYKTGTMSQDDSGGAGTGSQAGVLDNTAFSPTASVANVWAQTLGPTVTAASTKTITNAYSSSLSLSCVATGTITNAITQRIYGPASSGAGTKPTTAYSLYVTKGSGSTNNITAYFDTFVGIGTTLPTEALHVSGNIKCSGSILSSSAIGYSSDAWGAVTQLTSKSTAVTINKISGQITMHSASLAANASVAFTMTNSTITANDQVLANTTGGFNTNYVATAFGVQSGSVAIYVTNIGTTQSEAVKINFAVVKGSS